MLNDASVKRVKRQMTIYALLPFNVEFPKWTNGDLKRKSELELKVLKHTHVYTSVLMRTLINIFYSLVSNLDHHSYMYPSLTL